MPKTINQPSGQNIEIHSYNKMKVVVVGGGGGVAEYLKDVLLPTLYGKYLIMSGLVVKLYYKLLQLIRKSELPLLDEVRLTVKTPRKNRRRYQPSY